jgi:DNA-binding NtrC family response regulator
MARKSILVVDDEKSQREILEMILSGEGYDVTTASSGEAAIKFAKDRRFDLALTDLKMTGMDGIELLQHLLGFDSSIIVILLTAHGSIESAKEALRRGAFDYLEKPYDKTALLETINRALERLDALDTEIISASPNMEAVKRMILKVARSNSTVLIRGESGTGKELIARAIHNQSPRAQDMFQAVNCAAINENLLESELFGHEKGSFTGALDRRIGKFELAEGGTLFLDEVGDIPLELQTKLLRVLQDREYSRVGGREVLKADVRILAATNQDLERAVKEKRFREDLYFRLKVIPIYLPPLRERRGDIALLIAYFIEKINREMGIQMSGVSPEAQKLLEEHIWPGNVRELENTLIRAAVLSSGPILFPKDFTLQNKPVTTPLEVDQLSLEELIRHKL